jgi:NAD(P)-dependent dehydrogenase (short-subunit alcohol dehydrogenase family)
VFDVVVERFRAAGALMTPVDGVDASKLAAALDVDFVRADVASESDVSAMLETPRARHGRRDIVVNDAAIQPVGVGFEPFLDR